MAGDYMVPEVTKVLKNKAREDIVLAVAGCSKKTIFQNKRGAGVRRDLSVIGERWGPGTLCCCAMAQWKEGPCIDICRFT